MAEPYVPEVGDLVRRADQDWGEGRVIGRLGEEARVGFDDLTVVAWVPWSKLMLVGVDPQPGDPS